jgi:hypothetical protein
MNLRDGFLLITSLLAGSACAISDAPEPEAETTSTAQGLTLTQRTTLCSNDPRVLAGVLSLNTCIGGDEFFRESFNGNGRTCATCHRANHNLVMDAGFMANLPLTDPLFVAETNPALAGLELPTQMRTFGLILENLDGFGADSSKHFVLRSVPHTLGVGTSSTPNQDDPLGLTPVARTGWSGDGSPSDGSVTSFLNGAILQHYPKTLARVINTDLRLATTTESQDAAQYMNRVGRQNELTLANVTLSDPNAQAGNVKFRNIACMNCHFNAGANLNPNIGFGGFGNRNFNTGVEASRHLQLAGFPVDGGFGLSPTNPDGSQGNGTFNVQPLIEAADTGPFFHTATRVVGASAHNTEFASTIEEAVAFYDSQGFRNSPSGPVSNIDLTAAEIDQIGRFLRGLNAGLNIAQAVKRLQGAAAIINNGSLGDTTGSIQTQLMSLATVDMQDAITEMNAALVSGVVTPMNSAQSSQLSSAISLINAVLVGGTLPATRLANINNAISIAQSAQTGIATGMNYVIGEGTLMF